MKLLNQGTRWRVGSRHKISILKDKWVPQIQGFTPTLASGNLEDDSRVHELINVNTGQWCMEKITRLFSSKKAEAIMRIPLSQYCGEDKLIWTSEGNGLYTVKSEYRQLCQNEVLASGTALADMLDNKEMLRHIWRSKIPPKICIFGWHLFNDLLPTRAKLAARHINKDATCSRCREGPETTYHIITECCNAKEAWELIGRTFDDLAKHQGTNDSIDGSNDNPSWFELSLVTAWSLWGARNTQLHEGELRTSYDIARLVVSLLTDYQKCQQVFEKPERSATHRWTKPPDFTIKVNFDGAFDGRGGAGGIGIVARNNEAALIRAVANRIPLTMDSFVVEALAATKALRWALDMGFTNIQLEGDALSIIRKIRSQHEDFSNFGVYISEAKYLLLSFVSCESLYCSRECNKVAHLLAQHGLSVSTKSVWIDEGSQWLIQAVYDDIQS